MKGKKATCYFAIKDEYVFFFLSLRCYSLTALLSSLINAGADYSEEKVVEDGNLVSAQTPEDLPGFMAAVRVYLA